MTLRAVGDGEDKGGRPSGEFDPWSTVGNEYDPDQFYTRSTNKADHSIDERFRFPPHLHAMVAEIVDSQRFPKLRSVADFWRDSAVHRAHYLNEQIKDGKFEKELSLEMRVCRIEARQQDMTKMQEVVAKHRESLESARQAGDIESLSEGMSDLEDDIYALRQPYKNQCKELGKTYREILKTWISERRDDDDGS